MDADGGAFGGGDGAYGGGGGGSTGVAFGGVGGAFGGGGSAYGGGGGGSTGAAFGGGGGAFSGGGGAFGGGGGAFGSGPIAGVPSQRELSLERRLAVHDEKATGAAATIQDLQRRLAEAEARGSSAQEERTRLNEEVATLRPALADAERRATSADAQLARHADYATVCRDRDEMRADLSRQAARVSELQGAMRETITILQALQTDNRDLSTQLTKERDRYDIMIRATAVERDTALMRSQQVSLQAQATSGTIAIALAGKVVPDSAMRIASAPISLTSLGAVEAASFAAGGVGVFQPTASGGPQVGSVVTQPTAKHPAEVLALDPSTMTTEVRLASALDRLRILAG